MSERFVRVGRYGIAVSDIIIYDIKRETEPEKCILTLYTGYHTFTLEGEDAYQLAHVLAFDTRIPHEHLLKGD